MKLLYVDEEIYESEKIYKGVDFIKGDGFEFRGINDWSKFKLEEGQEWDICEEDEQALYYLDTDFRLSLLEMGVSINDL